MSVFFLHFSLFSPRLQNDSIPMWVCVCVCRCIHAIHAGDWRNCRNDFPLIRPLKVPFILSLLAASSCLPFFRIRSCGAGWAWHSAIHRQIPFRAHSNARFSFSTSNRASHSPPDGTDAQYARYQTLCTLRSPFRIRIFPLIFARSLGSLLFHRIHSLASRQRIRFQSPPVTSIRSASPFPLPLAFYIRAQ